MSDPVSPDWRVAPPWARYWTQDKGGCFWHRQQPLWSAKHGVWRARGLAEQINDTPGPRRIERRPQEEQQT